MADILVLQAARLGDLVQSKRLVLSVAKQGQVHLAVDRGLADMARLLYPDAVIHTLTLHGQLDATGMEQNIRIVRQWQGMDFQTVFNCNFSELTAALCRSFAPESIIGYRPVPGGILRSPWARMGFRLGGMRGLTPLNLVDFWGHFADEPVPSESVNPVARRGGEGIGVVLAGRESRRSLPLPVLAQVVQTVHGLLDGPRIRLLGSRTEQPFARKLMRLLPGKLLDCVEDLSGKTDWSALIQAVAGLDVLITPDTGIMHLAAHLGTPVLAFFLSSAWCHETGPYGLGHHVWQATTHCAPCLESAPCPYQVRCLSCFQSGDFLRSLALVMGGNQAVSSISSAGSQVWRSDLDGLGGRFDLLAGCDESHKQRNAVRAVLAEFLRLPSLPIDEAARLHSIRENLCPDSEWMLPPWRYA